jgi:hypothetical protein
MVGVFFAWIFFRADSFADAFDVIGRLGDLPGSVSPVEAVGGVAVAALFVWGNQFAQRAAVVARERFLALPNRRIVALAVLTLVCWTAASVLARGSLTPFVYFQF